MITTLDAMLVVAKPPDQGVTFREFITRSCELTGDGLADVIEETLRLGELDGIMADDIVQIGPAGTKLQ